MNPSNIQMKDTNDGVVVKADGRTLLAKLVFAGSARSVRPSALTTTPSVVSFI